MTPDWVMLGAAQGDGVVVLASTTMTRAVLELHLGDLDEISEMTLTWTSSYVTVTAPDYERAFAKLHQKWTLSDWRSV